MKSIAIITARGGSKRIPKKNIRRFCGKPIIAYSIEAAKNSGLFDVVMVSTDSKDIASIARKYGAEVPFMRSEQNSSDFATTNDVLEEVLDKYAESGLTFDMMACIYPTAPFININRLKEAYTLVNNDNNSVMAVTQYSFPPQRGLIIKSGKMVYREEEHRLTRSQDLEPIYHDAGQFYFYRIKENRFIDDDYAAVILPEIEVQDIDNISDWEIAELKYQLLKKRGE